MIVAEQEETGSGPFPLPEKSTLVVGTIYDAVVLEVTRKHAFVGIGNHEDHTTSWINGDTNQTSNAHSNVEHLEI